MRFQERENLSVEALESDLSLIDIAETKCAGFLSTLRQQNSQDATTSAETQTWTISLATVQDLTISPTPDQNPTQEIHLVNVGILRPHECVTHTCACMHLSMYMSLVRS